MEVLQPEGRKVSLDMTASSPSDNPQLPRVIAFVQNSSVHTPEQREVPIAVCRKCSVRHSMNGSTSAVTLRNRIQEPGKATAEGKLQFEGMPTCSLGSSSMIQAVREN